jgi:phosphoserine phosphatase RsbU/P
MAKILIVEDEPGIAFSLESDLQAEGYEVAIVGDGLEAVCCARGEAFDLILLDVMLPRKDGFEVCRELRQGGLSTPIMMLTAKTHEFDKVLGLDLGADDYVTKPFSPRELRARIRAALRHQAGRKSKGDLEGQLQVAAEVQQRLFPQCRPPLATLDYIGFCQPARGMSGDYYDFLHLAPGRLGLLVADVVGKGLPAALLMASVHASVRTNARLFGEQCGDVLAKVNTLLYEATDADMFATVFYGVYDEPSRVLTYANAGHEPPIVLRVAAAPDASAGAAEEGPTLIEGSEKRPPPILVRLDSRTPPLGILPTLPALQTSLQLAPGNWLLIFTDGMIEARNEDGEEFGEQRLLTVITQNCERTAEEMRNAILAELSVHSRGRVQADDVTLIAARVL